MEISREHQHTLLNIAEWSIINYLEGSKSKKIPEKFNIDEFLNTCLGVFVSIYVNKDLRGCIGTFSESEPIYKNVHRMAVHAAFHDDRFKPVTQKDITGLKVEISVIFPREQINGPEDIIIGKHGIYLIHGIRRATLLPQVAVENRLGPIEFLECCAKNKLGMTKDSWKDADLYIYETIIIK